MTRTMLRLPPFDTLIPQLSEKNPEQPTGLKAAQIYHYSDNMMLTCRLTEDAVLPSEKCFNISSSKLGEAKGHTVVPAGSVVYLSIDGSKYESRLTPSEARQQAIAFARVANLPPRLAQYMLLLVQAQEIGVKGILGKHLLDIPYLATGTPATFDRNDAGSYFIALQLAKLANDTGGLSVAGILEVGVRNRAKFTVESCVVVSGPGGTSPAISAGDTIPVDFLGFAAYAVPVAKPGGIEELTLVPILDRGSGDPAKNRLTRAIWIGSFPDPDKFKELARIWARFTCLYLLGGWEYPGFGALYTRFASYMGPLIKNFTPQQLDDLADALSDQDGSKSINNQIVQFAFEEGGTLSPASVFKFYGAEGASVFSMRPFTADASRDQFEGELEALLSKDRMDWGALVNEIPADLTSLTRTRPAVLRARTSFFMQELGHSLGATFDPDTRKIIFPASVLQQIARFAFYLPKKKPVSKPDLARISNLASRIAAADPAGIILDRSVLDEMERDALDRVEAHRTRVMEERARARAEKALRKTGTARKKKEKAEARQEREVVTTGPVTGLSDATTLGKAKLVGAAIKEVKDLVRAVPKRFSKQSAAAGVEPTEFKLISKTKEVPIGAFLLPNIKGRWTALRNAINAIGRGEPAPRLPAGDAGQRIRPLAWFLFTAIRTGLLGIGWPGELKQLPVTREEVTAAVDRGNSVPSDSWHVYVLGGRKRGTLAWFNPWTGNLRYFPKVGEG